MPVSRRLTEDHSTTPTNAISQAASAAVRRGGLCGEGEEARVKQTNQRVSRNRKNTGDSSRFGFGQLQRVRLPGRGPAFGESEADRCAGGGNIPEALDMLARSCSPEDAHQELARDGGQAKVEGPL